MAGEVRRQTVVPLIKFCAYIQFSAPKPPLLLAKPLCFMTKNENDSKKRNKAKRTSKECYAHIAFLPTPT